MAIEAARIEICNLTLDQYPQIKALMDDAYPDLGGAWPRHAIEQLIADFPEGQLGILDEGQLVRFCFSTRCHFIGSNSQHRDVAVF